ncbi:MAG: ferredoxin reductase [Micromonosporaceae bacterium]
MATRFQAPKRAVRRLLASPLAESLASPHSVDSYLELVNPLWSVAEARARVVAVGHPTPDSVTLTLKPNGNWRGHRPGQYVRVGVEIDGVRRTRCFSPASSARRPDDLIELTAKVNPSGEVTRYLKAEARPGMVVTLSQAQGEFILPTERPARLLLISGGSGITPVMSMLRTLCDEGYAGELTFLHYAFTPDHVIYADELAQLAAWHPNVTLLRAYTESDGGELQGLFSRDHLFEAVPDYADAETYLCGPPPLMRAVENLWTEDGLADRLHTEQFVTAPPAPAAGAAATGTVSFTRSDTNASNDGRSLLEQAEAAGLTPEYGCRMGICFSCTSPKKAGTVRNLLTGNVNDEPDTYIQLCVNVPCGDVTLDI